MSSDEPRRILGFYNGEPPGVKANLWRLMHAGRLAGTGKLVILPVDQGFEHGPARAFAQNPDGYDPSYHFDLAIESGCSAYAAPLGALAIDADRFAGRIPLILKVNHGNSLSAGEPDQAVTASVDDALRLGCSAIGYTIYPGSDNSKAMYEDLRELIAEARSVGLPTIVWSYARGGTLDKEGETAIDVIAYGAHMACQLGAHVVKVKPPTAHVSLPEARKVFEAERIPVATLADRVRHVLASCFGGRRIVIFSGGATKGTAEVLDEVRELARGGAYGSILGRNAFQRPRAEGLRLLTDIMDVFAKGR